MRRERMAPTAQMADSTERSPGARFLFEEHFFLFFESD